MTLISRFQDRKLHNAARYLSRRKAKLERAEVKRVAREMRKAAGLPPSQALVG